MNSTRRARRTAPAPPTDELEEIRTGFYDRLKSDRVHFVTLSAALARADDDPAPIFLDLRNRAHKIRGGAAIFEITEVAVAACSLELAAIAATMSHANNADPAVWSALVALVDLMGTLGDRNAQAPVIRADRSRSEPHLSRS